MTVDMPLNKQKKQKNKSKIKKIEVEHLRMILNFFSLVKTLVLRVKFIKFSYKSSHSTQQNLIYIYNQNYPDCPVSRGCRIHRLHVS